MNDKLCHNVSMDELKKLTEQLEYLLLRTIIETLDKDVIGEEDAKLQATEFLKLEPFMSIEEAKKKMGDFVQTYGIFNKLKDYVDTFHDEQKINAVIQKMQKHLQNNDVDNALEIAKSSQ